MAELSRSGRARTPSVLLAASLMVLASTFVGVSLQAPDGTVDAAPLSLTFEPVSNTRVSLGALASRTQCGPLTREGQGPYTMRGIDSSTGQPYSYSTDSLYNPGAQQRESREAATTISYSSGTNESVLGRTGVLRLASNGNISFTNTCSFGGSNVTVYGSAFGPQVYTQAFQATAGQALSFDWAAQGGGDDYEVYGFLVRVANSSDYGSAATTTVLAYGRGRTQGWTTSTGLIPADGWYRFRFVNGSYDKSGGYLLGATMYVDPRVLVGEANNITFGTLTDRITSGTNQTFTISATTSSNGVVNFTSTTTGRCTVGSSTLSGGVSTATVTLLANQTGLCTIAADSASTGEYATAATVTRSFNLLAAPTAPTNSGGTTVSGTAAIGQTMTAVDGSWADGGSAILSTTYQWQSCLATSCSYTDIAGAVDSTIVLGSSDVGRKVRVKVTKTNSIGSTTVISGESATIAKGNQSALTISSTTATYGQVLTLTTSGGSGTGSVTYSKVSGTCTLSGDQLTPGDAGSSCVLTATKAGDAAFNPVTSASTTIVVNRAAQAPVTVTSTSGTFGTTLALTATGGSGTGAISWRVVSGACTLVGSSLAATAAGNTCQVAATRAADTNHLAEESAATTVAFARASQSNAVVVTPMSLTYGQTATLAATGGSGTGAIEFTRVSGPCTVSGTSVTSTNLGTCVVTATKLGDSNYFDASSSPASLAIGVRTLTVQVTANNKPYDGGTSATLSLGALSGIVNGDDVSLNPSRVTGTFFDDEVGQNKLVILSVLSNALQGADASKYTLATPTNPRADIVRAGQSALTFMNASQMTVGGSLTLDATGGQSTGGVTYSVPSGDCAIANGVLTATKGGITCVVTATRAGDSRYNPVSTTQTVTINKITQVLRFQNTAPSSAVVGGTWTATVTSDAFLAATLAVANSSSSVCSLSADVVTFLAPGTCLVSASQAGTDTYAPAAISQSINVTAAPPPPAPGGSTTGSTVPGNSPTGQTPVTTVAPSTTTTTTTTIPNQGDPSRPMTDASGALPDLEVGTTTALVRGQQVLAEVITNQNNVTIVLPNEVSVVVGATDGSGAPLPVDADGAIRVFDDNLIRVTISGLIPGTTYTAYLFSEPVEIGRGVANGAGQVDGEFSIPAELEAGSHTLQVNGVGPNSEVVSVALGIAVMEKTDNTRIVLGLIGAAILVAMFIPLGFRRRARQAF